MPRFFKARPVAYALREKIETELDRLVKEGTIEPVEFSEWATPIVPIVKEDGTIGICGDYKQTINQAAKLDNYPIPKIEDLYATLGGGTEFTKLDLSQAYQQLELDEESQTYSYFEKGCRKKAQKCTRQDRKVVWVEVESYCTR